MNAREVVIHECMKPGGFANKLRENCVDEAAFSRLLNAVRLLSEDSALQTSIERLIVACLFELPWEIENSVEHYSKQSHDAGARVSNMAESLRHAINELLWNGLESYYDG